MPNPATAIGVGGSIVGGILGGNASGDAADAMAAASKAGVAENRRQFNTVLGLGQPAINTGNSARSLLASILGLEVPATSFTAGGPLTTPTTVPTKGHGRLTDLPAAVAGQAMNQSGGYTFTSPAASPMSADAIMERLTSLPGYQFAVDQAVKGSKALGSATGSLGGNVSTALASRIGNEIAMPTFENYLNRLSSLAGGAQTASNTVSSGALATGANVAAGLRDAGDARASGILGRSSSQLGMLQGILGAFGAGG